MGFTTSIFNAAAQLTYQSPPVYPIPAGAGGLGGGSGPLGGPAQGPW